MAIAVIAGTTGLIGSILLDLLLDDPSYSKVIALTRKPLDKVNPKLHNLVVNFDTLDEYAEHLKGDDVFCCLGTTIKQAGSQEAFRKVDYDYPVKIAGITKAQGAKQYLLITALGSDRNSSIFYNRVKGEVEDAIKAVGFEGYHIFQPSMLLGERKEQRAGESAGKWVMTALGFLIPKKFKAIEASKVARGMLSIAKKNQSGLHIHQSLELQNY
jgi:uncharacterized protein YbjT (DUF2867 family)